MYKHFTNIKWFSLQKIDSKLIKKSFKVLIPGVRHLSKFSVYQHIHAIFGKLDSFGLKKQYLHATNGVAY